MKVVIDKTDYEEWAQHLCPCFNPYCSPKEHAPCKGGKHLTYGEHKQAIEEWLLEDLLHPPQP
jgi:hypothetical protein